jgi:NAD+ synthase (glutamine-hydrolysing)
VLRYAKQLLPTYNIFDERRHFEPGARCGAVLRIGGTQVGLPDLRGRLERRGQRLRGQPVRAASRDAAPDLVVSINASPSNIGKREQRHRLFAAASRRHGLPLVYVNQVGGHDQLVFDGASFAVEPRPAWCSSRRASSRAVSTLRFGTARFLRATGSAAAGAAGRPCHRWSSTAGRSCWACATTPAAAASAAWWSAARAASTAR